MLIFTCSRSQSPLLACRLLLLATLLSLLIGCTPRQLIVGSLADELAAQGSQQESDLELARDAAPFYLKLSESVLLQQPGHRALAEAVAGGFTRYAYAFIASEAERIEAHDSKQASRWFDQAIAQSAGRNPAAYVAKAEGIALPAGDRTEFEALLNKALAITPEKPGLQDQLMQRRARWLLEQAPDLF